MLAIDGEVAVGMARGEPWDGRPGIAGLFGMWVDLPSAEPASPRTWWWVCSGGRRRQASGRWSWTSPCPMAARSASTRGPASGTPVSGSRCLATRGSSNSGCRRISRGPSCTAKLRVRAAGARDPRHDVVGKVDGRLWEGDPKAPWFLALVRGGSKRLGPVPSLECRSRRISLCLQDSMGTPTRLQPCIGTPSLRPSPEPPRDRQVTGAHGGRRCLRRRQVDLR